MSASTLAPQTRLRASPALPGRYQADGPWRGFPRELGCMEPAGSSRPRDALLIHSWEASRPQLRPGLAPILQLQFRVGIEHPPPHLPSLARSSPLLLGLPELRIPPLFELLL